MSRNATAEGLVRYDLAKHFPAAHLPSLEFRVPSDQYGLQEVSRDRSEKIDSTGNLLWPAEELLALAILKGDLAVPEARTLRILELGAGFSGLAGLLMGVAALASGRAEAVHVCLTDGNQTCAECSGQ